MTHDHRQQVISGVITIGVGVMVFIVWLMSMQGCSLHESKVLDGKTWAVKK